MTLDQTWNLEAKLAEVSVSIQLKSEIDKFVLLSKKTVSSGIQSLTGLYRRANLAYILDNLSKPSLLLELQEFNIKNK